MSFNRLTDAEAERLAILETNRWALERELGDLMHATTRMIDARDLNNHTIAQRQFSKPERIKPYLHHQGGAV